MRHVHSDEHYQDELHELRDRVAQMGACAASMIADSVQALVARDSELARRTILLDPRIDGFEVEANELALDILAGGRLAASDLRFITTGLKVVSDLERIGDLCVNICQHVLALARETPLDSCDEISRLGGVAQARVCDVVAAFIERDPERARRVIERARASDGYDERRFSDVLERSRRDARDVGRMMRVYSAAKCLECIGDDAVHIAEMVVSWTRSDASGPHHRAQASHGALYH